MPVSPPLAHLRARRAVAVRNGNQQVADEVGRDLNAAVLERHIRNVVDTAPGLTAEARDRLAALLRPAIG